MHREHSFPSYSFVIAQKNGRSVRRRTSRETGRLREELNAPVHGRFCAADDELATHELFVVEFEDGALGLID